MSTTITVGSAGVTAEVRQAYDLSLLHAAIPELVHCQFAEKRPIPMNQGKTINLRRFELLTAATTALVEGVTPNGSTQTITNIQVSVAQYGFYH